jgi:tetratricopeptide (TPR) repeat protein
MDKIYVKQATDLLSTQSYLENLDFLLSPFGFAFRKVKIRHAIQLYEKAIAACFELSKQSDSVGEYYMEIGYLYGIIGEPLKSADNYLKSAENYLDTNRAFISMSFAMDIYFSLKRDNLTNPIYVKIVDCYRVLSDLHYKLGEYAECAKYLDKCINESNRYDFSNRRIEFYEKLAFIYLIHLDKHAIALTMCEEIVRIDKTENRNKYLKICEYLRKDDLDSSRQLALGKN